MNRESFLFRSVTGYTVENTLDQAQVADRQVGTLGYTMAGLAVTMALILIGAFAFNMIIQLVSTLLPKQLSDAGATNATIALLITTIPSMVTMVLNPVFSSWSDRTRTRRGRRIPFLLLSAPLIAGVLALIGWAPQLAELYGAAEEMSLMLLGVLAVAYAFLFMIPGSILWYLFPDTIPLRHLARFMAFFQVISSLAGIVFARWLMPFATDWMGWLYTGVGAFYLLAMLMLSVMVREGNYPPVTDQPEERKGVLQAIRLYCTECYSIPFYYWFFCTMALSDVSMVCRTMFNLLYAQNTLGISLDEYGAILSWGSGVGLVLSLPLGWLSDKLHPMRVFGISLLLVVAVNCFSFFFVRDAAGFRLTWILLAIVYTMQGVSTIPVFVEILPKSLYGQFSSANALFRAFFMAICGYGGGKLLDYLGNYQYIYAWDFLFTAIALFCYLGLYRSWQRRGGSAHYIAPMRD